MTGNSALAVLIVMNVLLLCAGCDALVSGPVRDNPNDPASPIWTTQRPFISNVSMTADNKVRVNWVCSTKYGIYFRVERRVITASTYALIGTVPGSAATNIFIDSTSIPVGHTYGYRVGVVGSGGAVTYSYDFPIDIF
jgi:hypothetical protein